VAEYQVAETTTAATFETAELYRTLAHDLLQSERPKKLSSEELEQYNSLLEEQAYPFEEQAISIHELNAKRAQDGVYDEWVRKSYGALAELKPARYAKTELSSGMIGPIAQSGPPAIPPPSAAMQVDFQRAIDLANSGKHTDAELEFKQFELQHAGYTATAIDLGLMARQDGKLADSEAALRHATELDSSNSVAWNELGITLRSQGKFAEAREAYQHAISANDSFAAAHRNLGVLLDLYVGDPAAAIPELERYKALTAEDKPVSTWIAELRTRTGIKAPVAAPVPDNGAPSTPAAAPSTTAASNSGGPT